MRLQIPAVKPGCRATVIIPVHNEEIHLAACLDSLYRQTVPHVLYEVILLLNNCTDASVSIAESFRSAHTPISLHCVVASLPKREANVGTARRLLMDQASRRLPSAGSILSTDGDTRVAANWIEANLNGLSAGADVVGGDIAIDPSEYAGLPESIRNKYEEDALYQTACTRLESLVDPDPFDEWPRHHHHFGASLACTNQLYEKLGGLPQVESLEDVAFVKAALRADARVRHSPAVRVWTTARTSGRATVGFASQLREWEAVTEDRVVDSAVFLSRYFHCRSQLRCAWGGQASIDYSALAAWLGLPVRELEGKVLDSRTFGELHDALDLRGNLWRRMPKKQRVVPIRVAIQEVTALCAEERQAGIGPHATRQDGATPGGSGDIHAPHLPTLDSPGQSA